MQDIVFPLDLTLELPSHPRRTPSQSKRLNPIFASFDAINLPVLVVTTDLYVIHTNASAQLMSLLPSPLHSLFPDLPLLQKDSKIVSQHCNTNTHLFDVSVGKLGDSHTQHWILTLSMSPLTPMSRYKSEFQELSQLGKGGFGKVFKVKHRIDGQEYAIKKVRYPTKPAPTHLLREAQTFASLQNHPNVVRYYSAWIEEAPSLISDSDTDDEPDYTYTQSLRSHKKTPHKQRYQRGSFVYIQMQLCLLSDLRCYIDQRISTGFMNSLMNLEILYQVLSGLAHIHNQNIVHRDLKPENIFVDGERVLLGDFGMAKVESMLPMRKFKEAGGDTSADQGTYLYTAPEIIACTVCTTKADIYSYGIVFLELFSTFSTGMERAEKSLNLPEEFINLHPEESAVIQTCLLPNPQSRPTASALLDNPIFHSVQPASPHPTHSLHTFTTSISNLSELSFRQRKPSFHGNVSMANLGHCRSLEMPGLNADLDAESAKSELFCKNPVDGNVVSYIAADTTKKLSLRITSLEMEVLTITQLLAASQLRETQLQADLAALKMKTPTKKKNGVEKHAGIGLMIEKSMTFAADEKEESEASGSQPISIPRRRFW